MNNIFPYVRVLFFLFLFSSFSSPLFCLDCPNCGKKEIAELILLCPECGKPTHAATGKKAGYPGTLLSIEIKYTGNALETLPEYGKLFIGGIYKGNIPLIEKRERERIILQSDRKGIGFDYTALYRLDQKNLDEGVYNFEIEMQFTRWKGFLKEKKRVLFPRIAMKKGEKTQIRHEFKSPQEFSSTEKKKKTPSTSTPVPVPELEYGSGTISLELPIVK